MRHIALVLVVAVLSTVPADAAVRTWLSTNGNDSAPCTRIQPCRTLTAAIPLTDPQGEVAILDSGGYSPATIGQPISIIAPPGVHAAIAPTAQPALTISVVTGGGDVVLRNLYINSQGASVGLEVEDVDRLHLEGVVVSGFQTGINFNPADAVTNNPRLFIKDSVIRNCSASGITSDPTGSGTVVLSVSGSRLEGNNAALTLGSLTRTSVHDSVLAANFDTAIVIFSTFAINPARLNLDGVVISDSPIRGIRATGPTVINIRDSSIVRNNLGIHAEGVSGPIGDPLISIQSSTLSQNSDAGVRTTNEAEVNIVDSMITNNGVGVATDSMGSVIRLFSNFISGNGTGVNATTGTVQTAGHNVSIGNGTDTIGPGLTGISTF